MQFLGVSYLFFVGVFVIVLVFGMSIYGFAGFRFRVLFGRWGFAPHYAEHVVDPLDGGVKLVMADPHVRHSVVIYDLDGGVVEWEFRVPGSRVPNPHIAHLVADENPVTGPFWSFVAEKINAQLGDIVCADMDNRLIVIDREKKAVKNVINIPDARWLHDIIPSKNGDGLIVDDYTAGWIRKIDFDGSVKWSMQVKSAAKISTIYAKASSHIESFGGDYLAVSNSDPYGVYEITDDGRVVWSCPPEPPCLNATWLSHPHSAFRYGLAELGGNLTVIGLEGGGGIIAIDRDCRPRWGFMKVHTNIRGDRYEGLYRPSIHGFFETTHVFPLLNGGIGAVDWRGKYSSQVVEIMEFPSKTKFTWLLAWDYKVGGEWIHLDPPLEISEWDNISIEFTNIEGDPLIYEVYATTLPQLYPWDYPRHWKPIATGTVKSGNSETIEINTKLFNSARIRVKSQTGTSTFKAIVNQSRN